jgi:hypothetical protein
LIPPVVRFVTDRGHLHKVFYRLSLEPTPRLSLSGEAEYDIHEQWEGGVKLAYILAKDFSMIGKWHSEYSWDGGLTIRF